MSNEFLLLTLQQIQTDIRALRTEQRDELHHLTEKVEMLMAWRWKIYGMSAAIASIFGFVVTIVSNWMQK
jgi:hypothetical protein